MTTPGPLTARLYGRLPEAWRDADTGALLAYLTGALSEGDSLERLVDRLPTALADPALADPEWLPWLAQHVGVPIAPGLPVAERRRIIAAGAGGLQAGTRDAIAAAAARALTGSRSVTVTPLLDDDEFRIGLRVIPTEAPDPDAVVAAVEQAGARPAGFDLVVTYYSATWATIEAAYPTWAHIEAAASWAVIESTAAGEAPAPITPTAGTPGPPGVVVGEDGSTSTGPGVPGAPAVAAATVPGAPAVTASP